MDSYYHQFIEDYISPEYPVDQTFLLDQEIAALPAKRQENPENPQQSQESVQKLEDRKSRSVKHEYNPRRKYDYFNSQTSYRLLSAKDLSNFEADIRRGEMSRQQLCQKYGVSRSTTSRFIRNYKDFGFLKARKPKTARPQKPDNISDLIGKLLADNPDMTYRDLKKRIADLPKTREYMQLQKEFFASFPK